MIIEVPANPNCSRIKHLNAAHLLYLCLEGSNCDKPCLGSRKVGEYSDVFS